MPGCQGRPQYPIEPLQLTGVVLSRCRRRRAAMTHVGLAWHPGPDSVCGSAERGPYVGST